MRKCRFAAQTYSPSQANDANGIVVQAVRPNSPTQLTTTYLSGSVPTASPGNSNGNNGNNSNNGNNGNNGNNNGNGQQQQTGSATSAAIPMVGLALAAVFGTALLL